MKPEEEDAIYAQVMEEQSASPDKSDPGVIRIAIRAAVAHERERAAKVCDDLACQHLHHEIHGMRKDEYATYSDAAAAIRRGE